MPLDRVDQLPLPNLSLYTFFSGLGLFYVCVYTLSVSDGLYQTFTTDIWCATVSPSHLPYYRGHNQCLLATFYMINC